MIKVKDDCLFCKIARKEVDANTLVIPKKHYEDIYSIDREIFLKIIDTGKRYATKLMTTLDKSALTFLVNYGDAQVIKHFHLHLLPDYMNKTHDFSKEEIYDKLKD